MKPLYPPTAATWKKLDAPDFRFAFECHANELVDDAWELNRAIVGGHGTPALEAQFCATETELAKWHKLAERRGGVEFLREVAPRLIAHVEEMVGSGRQVAVKKAAKTGAGRKDHEHAVIYGRIELEVERGASVAAAVDRVIGTWPKQPAAGDWTPAPTAETALKTYYRSTPENRALAAAFLREQTSAEKQNASLFLGEVQRMWDLFP